MAQLSVNLSALADNYKILKSKVGEGCDVACVVKSNAYGLGVSALSQHLKAQGCKSFFVATLLEAIELRLILGNEPMIAMLNGYDHTNAYLYDENDITPILNTIEQCVSYRAFVKDINKNAAAIAHFNTGMNRLGINPDDAHRDMFEGLNIRAIMSHFVSSEEKDNPLNHQQYKKFKTIGEYFPKTPQSICNSSGIFLDDSYHGEMVRPGMALYGLNPTPYQNNPMHDVVHVNAKIIQTHTAKKGESAGYNATYRFDKDSYVGIVDIGYADGVLRCASNKAKLYWNNTPCPVRGNISMDLSIIDLSHIPENQRPQTDDVMELIGPNQSADDLARDANTIGYEILTSLSRRYERKYINP